MPDAVGQPSQHGELDSPGALTRTFSASCPPHAPHLLVLCRQRLLGDVQLHADIVVGGELTQQVSIVGLKGGAGELHS